MAVDRYQRQKLELALCHWLRRRRKMDEVRSDNLNCSRSLCLADIDASLGFAREDEQSTPRGAEHRSIIPYFLSINRRDDYDASYKGYPETAPLQDEVPVPAPAGATGYDEPNYRPAESHVPSKDIPGVTSPGEGLQGTFTEAGKS